MLNDFIQKFYRIAMFEAKYKMKTVRGKYPQVTHAQDPQQT